MKRLQRAVLEYRDHMKAEARAAGAATEFLSRPVNCLIVEDDEMDAELSMAAVGSVGGVTATLATSGDQAMTMLEDHPDFDIAFIDLRLVGSKVQGTDLISAMRQQFPRTHIIIVTGTLGPDTTEFMAKEAQQGRGTYFGIIHKPLHHDNLEEILSKHRMTNKATP